MRILPAVMLALVAASPAALAEAWRATAALAPESPATCRQADISKLYFDFTETGSALLLKTSDGQTFSAPVASDGSVATTVTVPVGAKKFAVDLTGNARTRELQAFNTRYACRFTLTPLP